MAMRSLGLFQHLLFLPEVDEHTHDSNQFRLGLHTCVGAFVLEQLLVILDGCDHLTAR
jgi:hypothetical protein